MLRVVLTVCCVCVACELHGRATQHSIFAHSLLFALLFLSLAIGQPGRLWNVVRASWLLPSIPISWRELSTFKGRNSEFALPHLMVNGLMVSRIDIPRHKLCTYLGAGSQVT